MDVGSFSLLLLKIFSFKPNPVMDLLICFLFLLYLSKFIKKTLANVGLQQKNALDYEQWPKCLNSA